MSRPLIARSSTIAIALSLLASANAAQAQLEEVVVTAQKRTQNLQDVPIAVSAFGEQELDREQFTEIKSLTRLSPSLSFQDGFAPVASNFIMRGVGAYAFTGGIQPSVALIVDDVPLARTGEFLIDVADIERIEILRGPQGTLFGRNSTGGAVNITRNKPSDVFEASIDVSFTDDDEVMGRAMISGPLSDSVRGRLVGLISNRDGHIENLGPRGGELGGLEQVALVAKLEIDLGDKGSLLLTGDYSEREHGFTPQVADIGEVYRPFGDVTGEARAYALGGGDLAYGRSIMADPFKAAVSKIGDKNENDANGLSANLVYDFSENIRFKSITAWRDFTDENNPDVDGTPAEPNLPVMPIISVATLNAPNYSGSGIPAHSRGVDADYISQEFVLEISSERVDWTVGAFYQDFEESIKNNVALLILDSFNPAFGGGANVGGTPELNDEYILSNTMLNNSYSVESFAVFADATVHVTDRLDLFGGLRWTKEDLDSTLNNTAQIGPYPIASLASFYDATNMTFDSNHLPVFPDGGSPNAIGSDSTSEDFVSFRVGGSYAFTDSINGYASFSRGQVGAGKNIAFTGRVGKFLEPTVADSFEVGIKSQLLNDRLRLNLAAFTQEVTDLQASAIIPGTVSTETVNAGDLDVTGIEGDIVFALADNWTLNLAFATLDSEIKDLLQKCYFDQLTAGTGCTIDLNGDGVPDTQDVSGKQGTNAPDLKYNVGISAALPTNNLPFDFFANLNYVWQDDIQFTLNQDDLATQDAYGQLDLTFGIVDKNNRYEVQVYGKNITDKFYTGDAFEAFGALGRRVLYVPRTAQAYWGVRFKMNFN